jgi:hypothetical protein
MHQLDGRRHFQRWLLSATVCLFAMLAVYELWNRVVGSVYSSPESWILLILLTACLAFAIVSLVMAGRALARFRSGRPG